MKNRDLKGWEILLVAFVLYIVGLLLGDGMVGSLLRVGAYLLALISIAVGIRNLTRKK